MSVWRDTIIAPEATVLSAVQCLDRTGAQICLVCDSDGRLVGTVTDGDVRRGLLKAVPLDSSVSGIMNRDPVVGAPGDPPGRLLEIMNTSLLRQIPVVDPHRRVVDLRFWNDLTRATRVRDNWVILMAGGQGNRLRPLTEDRPKPLLTVGHKPLLESTLEAFLLFGFRRFFISVNYKADMVKEHFGDGHRWGCEVSYLEEESQLGTAGALGLLAKRPSHPIIVMNGDVLTKVNFDMLLDFHRAQKVAATMCVREYEYTVPFGVIDIADHRIRGIAEKPTHRSFVNAGIYVLEPSALDQVPKGGRLDMTDLFGTLIASGRTTAAFPIWEYWIDVGRIDDFRQANVDYSKIFER
ncbi:MAG: CBS domain-containing protein [Alphaproteobacteria bacterium]|nr:CBS domain-containing protein [Alphaproteobacteria bacterium]